MNRNELRSSFRLIKKCYYCGETDSDIQYQTEHIHPRDKGGDWDLTNLTRACKRCNCMKGVFTIEEWLQGLLKKRINANNETLKYLNRLRNTRRRNSGTPSELLHLENKVNRWYYTHQRFSAIIDSLVHNRYRLDLDKEIEIINEKQYSHNPKVL
ncbi:MAG: HNH endonuclease [Bacteriophage sp.]|nr:MAG: HNH endonuclease [Bacteriophage sp.]